MASKVSQNKEWSSRREKGWGGIKRILQEKEKSTETRKGIMFENCTCLDEGRLWICGRGSQKNKDYIPITEGPVNQLCHFILWREVNEQLTMQQWWNQTYVLSRSPYSREGGFQRARLIERPLSPAPTLVQADINQSLNKAVATEMATRHRIYRGRWKTEFRTD